MTEEFATYCMELAATVALRSSCPRGKVGALLVRGREIPAYTWNGAPRGTGTCEEKGCIIIPRTEAKPEESRHAHAEERLICESAAAGIATYGATVVVSRPPCIMCCRIMINARVLLVVIPTPTDEWSRVNGKFLMDGAVSWQTVPTYPTLA